MYVLKSYISVFLFFLVFLKACSPYPDLSSLKRSSDNPEVPHLKTPQAEIPPQAEIETGSSVILEGPLATYSVELKWNLGRETYDSVVIERVQIDKPERRIVATLPGTSNTFKDTLVPHNTNFLYFVYGITSTRSSELAEISVKTPRDFIVNGKLHLTEDLVGQFGRFVMGKDSTIVTQGFATDIQVEYLSADSGARFVSFEPELPALVGEGRASGSIRILSQKAYGRLQIQAWGQKGAMGSPGANAQGRGARGQDSKGKCRSMGRMEPPECYCERDATPGWPGPRGGDGGMGHRGGDSSPVLIEIQDPYSQFLVNVEQRAGLGGDGGPGGLGGPGGEPGKSLEHCLGNPPHGPQGENGSTGMNGPSGQILGFCIKIGNARTGHCH